MIFIDPDGQAKWRFSISLKSSTGIFALNAKVAGLPVGVQFSKGGEENKVQLYFEVDTDAGTAKFGAQKSKRTIESEKTYSFGITDSEVSDRETVKDWNVEDGSKGDANKDEKVFKDKETSSIGPVSQESTEEGETLKVDLKTGLNVGIKGLGGLGIEAGVEAIDEDYLNDK
jgi:hypothetical protein